MSDLSPSSHRSPPLELLSPAGTWECARAAVATGADAIYFGLQKFNARLRAVQERRRGMEAARRAQDDYERMQSDLLHQRIAPLRTLNHQTNERRRIAQTILNG